jgi:hypothetical protein
VCIERLGKQEMSEEGGIEVIAFFWLSSYTINQSKIERDRPHLLVDDKKVSVSCLRFRFRGGDLCVLVRTRVEPLSKSYGNSVVL